MRCDTTKEQIQNWFDAPGTPAMPAPVREHVRDCDSCRAFIKRWNAIEAGLQSLREQTPEMSPNFAAALNARLQEQPSTPTHFADFTASVRSYVHVILRPSPRWRVALVGGVAAILFLALYTLSNVLHLGNPLRASDSLATAHSSSSMAPNSPLRGATGNSLPTGMTLDGK